MADASHANSESGAASPKKRALGGDLIIPAGTILFAVYYLYTVWELPWQAKAAGIGVAGAMAIVLGLLAVRFVREWSSGRADLSLGDVAFPVTILAQRLSLLVAALAFVFLMPWLGFTLGLFTFLIVGMVILSGVSKLRSAVIISLLVSIGGYLLFIVLVRARFPHGPAEALLSHIF